MVVVTSSTVVVVTSSVGVIVGSEVISVVVVGSTVGISWEVGK